MGSSRHFSSASDKSEIVSQLEAEARIVPIREASDELFLAIARVELSLKAVLTHILAIQREMGISTHPSPDVPLKPDDSWIGTP